MQIVTQTVAPIVRTLKDKEVRARLYNGDCFKLLEALPDNSVKLTVTSPPYCIGKEYEDNYDVDAFIETHQKILPEIVRVTKSGGSICWQVGFHIKDGVIAPLDFLIHDILSKIAGVKLRNRIVWTYGHGLHCANRFSGRYEVIMWYTKGDNNHYFNLDAVRIPQKYPGKKFANGEKQGEFSGNPKGKNPSDVWDEIPNVKANHIEKTNHPCQYPVALVTRLVRALTRKNDLVLDPFSGVASTGVAALLEGRRFVGAEKSRKYIQVANTRLQEAIKGTAKVRPLERSIYVPTPNEQVAMKPKHFWPKKAHSYL